MNYTDCRDSKIFISYCHKDEVWKERLCTHLRALQRNYILDIWDDRQIKGGENWVKEITEAIQTARLAILMLSDDFLSSIFIQKVELPELKKHHATGRLRIMPIIVHTCQWKRDPWLASFQVQPKNGKPLASFKGHKRTEAFVEVAEQVEEMLSQQPKAIIQTPFKDGKPLERTEALVEVAKQVEEILSQQPKAIIQTPLWWQCWSSLMSKEHRFLKRILQFTIRDRCPPTVKELTGLGCQWYPYDLRLDDVLRQPSQLNDMIDRLTKSNWIAKAGEHIVFAPSAPWKLPMLMVLDLNQAVATTLRAIHVSTHFLANNGHLIAPWETCYTCKIDKDIVTDIEKQGGFTAYAFSNSGIYNATYEEIRKFEPLHPRKDPPPVSPVTEDVCHAVLIFTYKINDQVGWLVKVENKRYAPEGQRFTEDDENVLKKIVQQSIEEYWAAWEWVNMIHPNPKINQF